MDVSYVLLVPNQQVAPPPRVQLSTALQVMLLAIAELLVQLTAFYVLLVPNQQVAPPPRVQLSTAPQVNTQH